MLNVIALHSDRAGCYDYRVRFPAQAVNASDLNVHCEPADHLKADATFTGSQYHIRHVSVPGGVSVVSFQRPTTAAVAGMMEWLRQRRPDLGLVVELDDDIAGLPANNVAYGAIHGKTSPIESYRWFTKAIQCADVLTVSTPELAKRYGSATHPAFVVRNAVPESMLEQGPSNALLYKSGSSDLSDRLIGWAGYVGTHAGDPESTCNALADFVGEDETGREVRFRNIGPRDGIAKAFGLPEEHVEASGWLKPHEYRVALGSLDIGVVPLADTRFNASKSAIKGLEMLAAGVPVIASNLPEYVELQRSGAPIWIVRNTRREWSAAVRRVLSLTDGELKDLGEAGREYVRRYGTVTTRTGEWAAAWTEAARRGARRVAAGRSSH